MKGPNIDEELENSYNAFRLLGGEIRKIKRFCIGEQGIERTIIEIEKVKDTDKRYPRKAGIPKKQPL